ncbi:hypothetical protein ACFQX6_28655 [Streptosporangium lutulentum]
MRSVSRRALLRGSALGVAALTAAGCAAEEPKPVVAKAPDPETVLLNQLIAGKEQTIALYVSAASAKLAPFTERHRAHLAELRRRLSQHAPPASAPPSPTPSSATPTPGRRPTVRSLRALERRPRRSVPFSSPAPPPLAQLIASIGACEAAHDLALSRPL